MSDSARIKLSAAFALLAIAAGTAAVVLEYMDNGSWNFRALVPAALLSSLVLYRLKKARPGDKETGGK